MITIENYEEYFLLYVDNELPAELRTSVERFVADHPQTGEELEAMLQCRLEPDRQDTFHEKAALFHYDESLLSYVDGELDTQERAAVEALVKQEPVAGEELRRLQLTVNQPDATVVFPDKECLYRYEKGRRVILLPWLRAGVAAAVLAAAALLLFPRGRKEQAHPEIVAKKSPAAVTPSNPRTLYIEKKEEQRDQVKEKAVYATSRERGSKRAVKGGEAVSAEKPSKTIAPEIARTNRIADTGSRSTGVAIADITADKGETTPANTVAMVNIPREQSSFATQALLQEAQVQETGDQLAMTTETSGKNKFRGIFRRVTRAFGKTAERDDDGQREVLISAFQVALK